MQIYIPMIYDTIAIIIIMFSVAYCIRNGFMKSLVETVGSIASFLGSIFLSKLLANKIYELYVSKYAYDYVEKFISDSAKGNQTIENIEKTINSLPDIIVNALNSMGIDTASLINDQQIQQDFINKFIDILIKPACILIMGIILFIIIYAILKYIVRALARLLKTVNHIPVIGLVNRVAGGILGIAKGLISVFIVVQFLHIIIILFGNSLPFVNMDIIAKTYIVKEIFGINIFVYL